MVENWSVESQCVNAQLKKGDRSKICFHFFEMRQSVKTTLDIINGVRRRMFGYVRCCMLGYLWLGLVRLGLTTFRPIAFFNFRPNFQPIAFFNFWPIAFFNSTVFSTDRLSTDWSPTKINTNEEVFW